MRSFSQYQESVSLDNLIAEVAGLIEQTGTDPYWVVSHIIENLMYVSDKETQNDLAEIELRIISEGPFGDAILKGAQGLGSKVGRLGQHLWSGLKSGWNKPLAPSSGGSTGSGGDGGGGQVNMNDVHPLKVLEILEKSITHHRKDLLPKLRTELDSVKTALQTPPPIPQPVPPTNPPVPPPDPSDQPDIPPT
jgi:hypothetical protein